MWRNILIIKICIYFCFSFTVKALFRERYRKDCSERVLEVEVGGGSLGFISVKCVVPTSYVYT